MQEKSEAERKFSDKLKPLVRKILYSGNSHLITIPKKFLDPLGLKPGSRVIVIPGPIIQIVPFKED
ncbi:MAG: AbrB/MazE/SpoVT family DNA-binding domain-containing protein [Candidatus Methanomethylicaceae archaeon]